MGAIVVRRALTSGQLRMREDIPTLEAVAHVYDAATAIAWLLIEIDSVDITGGVRALDETSRKDAARLIFAKYSDMNVAELLLFFNRYKLGEYHERVQHVGGVQRLLLALRYYCVQREEDVRRLEREEINLAAARQREERRKKAISYDEYKRQKAADAAAGGEAGCGAKGA